jgi:hypothetical protein
MKLELHGTQSDRVTAVYETNLLKMAGAREALNQLHEPGSLSRTVLPKTPVLNDRRNSNGFSLPGRALLDKCVWYAEQRTNLADVP